jgi:hypothetical protein
VTKSTRTTEIQGELRTVGDTEFIEGDGKAVTLRQLVPYAAVEGSRGRWLITVEFEPETERE